MTVDDFFPRAVAVTVAGQKFRTFSDRDLTPVLCVHGAKPSWMKLSWLCDIGQLARSRSCDWEALQAQATRLGIDWIVVVSLLAHKLIDASLPQQLGRHRDPAVEALARRILPLLVAEAEFDPESIPYFCFDGLASAPDRVPFLWRLCHTPSAGGWSRIRLPCPLFPVDRVLCLLRLAGRVVSAIMRHCYRPRRLPSSAQRLNRHWK